MVRCFDEPVGELACGVVVDIDQRADAVTVALAVVEGGLLDSCSCQVPNGLGAILITAPGDDLVEVCHKVVVEGNRHTVHRVVSVVGIAGSQILAQADIDLKCEATTAHGSIDKSSKPWPSLSA